MNTKLNGTLGSLIPTMGHYLEHSEGQLATVAWTSTHPKKDKQQQQQKGSSRHKLLLMDNTVKSHAPKTVIQFIRTSVY